MRNVLTLLLLTPILLFAQKVKVNQYDKFIRKRVIETTSSTLRLDKSAGMYASLKSVGTTFYITLKGYGLGANTIQANDQAIFLLDNDSTVTAKSTAIQTYNVEKDRYAYNHEYVIPLSGLELLSQYNLVGVRKYGIKGHVDINIPQTHQVELRRSCLLLLSELAKSKVITKENASYAYTKGITLDEVGKHVGDSVTVCGKIFTSKYLQTSANKPTLLNVGAPYPEQPLTVVIYEDDRKNFTVEPESFFLDKEVCVTGRIELYNNRPQIVIRSQDKISFKSSGPGSPSTVKPTAVSKSY